MARTRGNRRQRLLGGLTAAALGGALAVSMSPSAAAKPEDPCAASAVAKTVSKVSADTGKYLEKNPETDRVISTALQQDPGPQSVMTLKNYFDANPTVADDLAEISEPLSEITASCRLPISLPQVLGLMQAAQNQQLPGQLPGQLPAQLPPAAADVLGKTGRLPGPAGAVTRPGPAAPTAAD
ncbi:hemophore [Mycobacterium sp. 1274756.6]|uniref:hemophore n=1 Tax=Mycobacterium sp. 1274756.6 TaxID=1834076 RepID=UPI0008008737|nr:hemophore [Mycobacterium sp. 1274756.6]OBJ71255.1 hemophore [Mycobacterium sp. 1274756.6]